MESAKDVSVRILCVGCLSTLGESAPGFVSDPRDKLMPAGGVLGPGGVPKGKLLEGGRRWMADWHHEDRVTIAAPSQGQRDQIKPTIANIAPENSSPAPSNFRSLGYSSQAATLREIGRAPTHQTGWSSDKP